MDAPGQPLLGRLAELPWFTQRGEVTATRGVAMLLEEPVLRTAFEEYILGLTGVDIRSVHSYLAESVNENGDRPDIKGVDTAGRPRVIVEAKFQASLTARQILSYLDNQTLRLAASAGETVAPLGVLLVLVPEARRADSALKLEGVLAERSKAGLAPYPVETQVISWDNLLDMWNECVRHLPASPYAIAADLYQFRGLCLTLGGLVIEPLAGSASGAEWRKKEAELRSIVDQATKILAGNSRIPIQDDCDYLARRYFTTAIADVDGRKTWAAMGIRPDVADAGGTPVWIRFHKVTPQFSRVREVLFSTDYKSTALIYRRHLWLPLAVDPTQTGPEIVESLVDQYRGIEATLVQSGAFVPKGDM